MSGELKVTRNPRSQYSDEEIEAHLFHLAKVSGNEHRTARETGINRATLRKWRKNHAARYHEIEQQVIPTIRAQVAERTARLAEQQADAEEQALALVVENLPNLDPRDLSPAMRNISVGRGISLTHLNTYQAPPGDGSAGGSVVEVLAKLERMGLIAKPVESTAEEVQEAEIVDHCTEINSKS